MRKNQEDCEVWWLRPLALCRYKGNCGTRIRTEKFRTFEKQAPGNLTFQQKHCGKWKHTSQKLNPHVLLWESFHILQTLSCLWNRSMRNWYPASDNSTVWSVPMSILLKQRKVASSWWLSFNNSWLSYKSLHSWADLSRIAWNLMQANFNERRKVSPVKCDLSEL